MYSLILRTHRVILPINVNVAARRYRLRTWYLFYKHILILTYPLSAGFFTAEKVLKLLNTTRIDIFEKLPAPFGLARYGVAPDHQDVKVPLFVFFRCR